MKSPIAFLFMFLLCVSFTSALLEKSVEVPTLKEGITISATADKYPAIKIDGFWDGFLWIDDPKADLVLTDHTETCGTDCMSKFQIVIYEESALIDDIKFYTLEEDKKTEQAIRGYNFQYWGNIDDEELREVCIENPKNNTINSTLDNGTIIWNVESCTHEYFKVGSHEGWINYNVGTKLPIGTYEVKLLGSKKPSRTVDWIIKTQGKIIDEWAVWGNISLGDTAEVILNSPADGSIQYTKSVTLNASGNVTGGAYLTNATLYDNSTGTWGARNTTTSIFGNSEELVSYYTLDETTGTVVEDSQSLNDGTNVGTADVNQAGKIGTSYYFDGNDYINLSSPTTLNPTPSMTWAMWINTTTNPAVASFLVSTGFVGYELAMDNTGKILSNVGSATTDTGFTPNKNVWTHIVWTINDSNMTLWVNGSYFSSADQNDIDGVQRNVLIGARRTLEHNKFTGKIDEVGMWNRTLTEAEVSTLYNSGEGSRPSSSTTQTFINNYSTNTLWNMQFCDSDGDCGFAPSNYTFSIDAIAPTVAINYPTALIDYGAVNRTLQLNFTATDTNLDKVWYNYNGTNVSIAGALTGVANLSNITLTTKKNVTIYANDTAGNLNATVFGWDYKVFEESLNYTASTTAGSTTSYTYNLTLLSGLDLTEAVFYYNGTPYSPSIISSGQNRRVIVSSFEVPAPATNTNYTFYLDITLSDATRINTTLKTQLVQAVLLDNCSVYTNKLFNISLRDEQTKALLNGDIQMIYTLQNKPAYSTIATYNFAVTGKNNTLVCSGINLSGEDLAYSAEIRYIATDHVAEFYNIQRADIGTTVQNLNLYDLNSSSSTEFKITYQDSSYNFVEGAIVQLQRKYISENLYEIVEAPLTSSEGTTLLHIDLNSVKYKVTVVKNGVVLDVFDNLVFKCQSELTGECEQKLLGAIDSGNDIDWDTYRDFAYSITENNSIVTVAFTVPSGDPSSVNIVLNQKDQFGNSYICNKTVTSSAGSIECTLETTIGDSFLDLRIYKNGEPMAILSYIIPETGGIDFGGDNYLIVIILMLSLVGMALSSPEWIVINAILTLVISGALYLVNGITFGVGLGVIMWLLIAAVILIMKLTKQEDR